jgi:hypothetical protein
MREQAIEIRETLPDYALQNIYDRRISGFNQAVGNPCALLEELARRTRWFDFQAYELPGGSGIGGELTASTSRMVWEHGNLREKKDFLRKLRFLSRLYCERSKRNIQEQWAEARRTRRQADLIETWKRRIERIPYDDGGASGQETKTEPVSSPSRDSTKRSARAVAIKTWVAFKLIDKDGKPVPGAAYKVTLPDESIVTGTLNDAGEVQFDDIDPGQCQITFPEIDAKEWN